MKLRYHVVTVTEGGADFWDYERPEDVQFDVNPWHNTDGGTATLKALKTAKLGDEIHIDGCSVCYVLKGK